MVTLLLTFVVVVYDACEKTGLESFHLHQEDFSKVSSPPHCCQTQKTMTKES